MAPVNPVRTQLAQLSEYVKRRRLELLGVLAVTAVGGLLRIDALVGSYGPVPLGSLLEAVQTRLASIGSWLHAGRMTWRDLGEYSGDPVAYLNNARAMTWFYEGRAREPVFNYATRSWLQLTGDADVAVSAASTLFSVLCVPATYLLGRLAFGRAVGVVAALVVAIEPDVIAWGVRGWRDDAFTFFFLAFGASCLFFRAQPSRGRAALLAVVMSLTLLTRLTALSFIAPACLLMVWEVRRDLGKRNLVLRRLAIAGVATVVLVSPYLINCWIRYGDPLVAINRNTTFYRDRAGQVASEPMRTDVYLSGLIRERPVATADTVLQGLTTYPFRNKFDTLGAWHRHLPRITAVLAVIGLLAWPWSVAGRWLLLLLTFSLVPYAFTWEIRGGAAWRFTMHAYPIYLVAAASCLMVGVGGVLRTSPGVGVDRRTQVRAATSAALAGVVAVILLLAPYPRLREALVTEQNAIVQPGWRDAVFFRRDWRAPERQGGVTSRESRGHVARVWVPLVPDRAYRVVASLAPANRTPDAAVAVRAYVNGRMMAWERLPDEQFGEIAFDVEADAVRSHNVVQLSANRLPQQSLSVELSGSHPLVEEPLVTLRSLHIVMRDATPEPEQP